ncbi:7312_t:CDS:1, partial [Scutellospora calospora]
MGFFVVCILRGTKTIIPDKVVNVLLTEHTLFNNVFNATTNDQFEDCIVRVFLRKPPEKWVYVEERLQGDVSMLFELNFTHIKFVLDVAETSIQKSSHQGPNAFDLLMKNSQNTQLPELKKENTRRDLLYNDIICLLQNKEVRWKNAMHNTIGKSFIEHLTAALWYIDPHCIKFTARYLSLGELFNELDQYKKDQHYNLFYNTGKHAKSNLKHDKLEQLASSLELSAIQPWAANNNWALIINEVFILISSMRKYANNLEQINQAMKKIHLSDTPARQPANDLKVYTIESCQKINIQYQQLQDFLSNVDDYSETNLERFLPEDIVQCYHYIKNLQIKFPVTLYRYYQ